MRRDHHSFVVDVAHASQINNYYIIYIIYKVYNMYNVLELIVYLGIVSDVPRGFS